MGTQPENTHGIQTQTQPNPYPKFGSGPGITLWVPEFWVPNPHHSMYHILIPGSILQVTAYIFNFSGAP